MNRFFKYPAGNIGLGLVPVLLFCYVFVTSCKQAKKEVAKESVEEVVEKADPVIEIVTNVMDFQCQDTIPSGWNAFRYVNNSDEAHFVLVDKYPEGRTEKDAEEAGRIFQEGMDLINQGKAEEGYAAFGKLPEWFSQVRQVGGVALVSPKSSAVTHLKLDPGNYLIECYVKMANGTFHTTMGMAKSIEVSGEESGQAPPQPTIDLKISGAEGITFEQPIDKGQHIFSVYFEDQMPHEHFMGHDVNLVRLDANADLEGLEAWMNWADPKGLISPPPAGVTFMGGVNDMPAGGTGYFEALLEPGNYAFISEVPNAGSKNMLKTFVVSE